jgi:hypothetical protein
MTSVMDTTVGMAWGKPPIKSARILLRPSPAEDSINDENLSHDPTVINQEEPI